MSQYNKIAIDIVRTQKWIANNPAFPETDSTANDLLTKNESVLEWIDVLSKSINVKSRSYNYALFIQHITNPKALCVLVKSFQFIIIVNRSSTEFKRNVNL
jgi:hypothetical protein